MEKYLATRFEFTDKPSDVSIKRMAQLEQLVGRLTVAVDIHERALTGLSGKTYPNAQDGNGSPE